MCCGSSVAALSEPVPIGERSSPWLWSHIQSLMEVQRVWNAWKQLTDYFFSLGTQRRSPTTHVLQYLLTDHAKSVKMNIDIIYCFPLDFQFWHLVRQVHPYLVGFVLFQLDDFRIQLFSLNFLLFIFFKVFRVLFCLQLYLKIIFLNYFYSRHQFSLCFPEFYENCNQQFYHSLILSS